MGARRRVSVACLIGILFEFGFLVHLTAGQSQNCPTLDLVLIIPTSSDNTQWSQLKTFLATVLGDLDTGGPSARIQVSVVKYTGTSQIEFQLNSYQTKASIISAINNMQQLSGTGRNVTSAEQQLRTVFDSSQNITRTTAQMFAVIFFDGPSDNMDQTRSMAQTLNDLGIYVLSFGLTSQVNMAELQQVATTPADVFTVSGYDQLSSQVSAFEANLCGQNRKPLCPKQADVAIIIDQSTSIAAAPGSYNNFELIKNFTNNIISAFPVASDLTRIGVVLFSTTSSIIIKLSDYTTSAALQQAVSKIEMQGGQTNIADALKDARTLLTTLSYGARLGIKKIIFLITDGKANINAGQTQQEANTTKAAGVEVYCVGMTNQIDVNELKNIASSPNATHFFYANTFGDLKNVLLTILNETCLNIQTTTTSTLSTSTTSPLTTTPTTTTPTTTTTTPTTTTTTPTTTTTTPTTTTTTPTTTTTTPTTTTTTPTTTTTTPTTTTTTPTTTTTTPTTTTTTLPPSTLAQVLPTCTNPVDVVFIVDVSGDLDYNVLQGILTFVQQVTLLLSIDSATVRVGLVTYSDQAQAQFYLNTYTSTLDMKSAILSAKYIGGSNNIAGALAFLQTTMFTTANGARIGVPHVGVLFVNSRSNNPLLSQKQADLCRRAGISLIVVALGTWLDVDEVNNIASYPSNKTVFWTTANTLSGIRQPLVDPICQNIKYCQQSNPCQNGGACSNQIGYSQCICAPGFGGDACNQVCAKPADVIFAIDSSGSIGLANWRLVTAFLQTTVQMLDLDSASQSVNSNAGTRVGLLTFSNISNIIFNLNTIMNKTVLFQALNTRYEGGSTNTADAIKTAVDQMFTSANGARPGVAHYLVIMTDGMSDDTKATWMQAARARDSGISIIAVGVGNQINYDELRAVASYPDTTNVITTANFSTLGVGVASAIGALLCNDANACLPNPCKAGTCQDASGSFTCGCPANITGRLCERNCTGMIDLVIVFDASGSIERERFPMVKEFIANLLMNFSISQNSTRVGVICFSDNATLSFYLNSYNEKQDVIQAVRSLPFIGGKTNIAAALRLLQTMYQDKYGGRVNARRIAIFMTDGEANIDATQTIPEAIKAHQAEIHIITVAAGTPAFFDSDNIEAIASIPTAANMFNISSYYALANISTGLIKATCNDFNDCMSNPCQGSSTCIDDYSMYSCICPPNYAGYNCERTCSNQMDVVFVLDLSGSTEDLDDYTPVINTVRAIIYGFDVRSGNVRVGAVTYSTVVDNQFYLKDYVRDPDRLIDAISFNHDGGATNTQAALGDVLNVQFTGANGDRPGVPNVVLFFSDGYSDVMEGSGPGAQAAQNLRASGATIYTVALGDAPNLSELGNIAGNTVNPTYGLPNWDQATISKTVNQILNNLCSS